MVDSTQGRPSGRLFFRGIIGGSRIGIELGAGRYAAADEDVSHPFLAGLWGWRCILAAHD
jgi:hypothetical protein